MAAAIDSRSITTIDLQRIRIAGRSVRSLRVWEPPPEPEAPDAVAPVVTVSPAAGTSISRGQTIRLDVTDATNALRRVLIVARLVVNGRAAWEVVHDGDAFGPEYSAASRRSAIAGGVRFTIARRGGWPSAPELRPIALDVTGNENA